MGSSTLVTPPTGLPVSVEDLKAHTRIDHATEDPQLTQLVKAATTWVEQKTRRALLTQTWDIRLDYFPRLVELPWTPLQTVDTVEYIDDTGATATLTEGTHYQVDQYSAPPVMAPAYGTVWPVLRGETLNAVRIRVTVGYGKPKDVPKDLRYAILMLCDHWYEHRGAISELRLEETPMALQSILRPLRVW